MTPTEQRRTRPWRTMAVVISGLFLACLLLVSGASARTEEVDGRSTPAEGPASGAALFAAPQAAGPRVSGPQATGTPCTMDSPYAYAESTGTVVPGTQDVGIRCDDCTTLISLPFTYNLYGRPFSSAIVGSNGTLAFVTNNNGPNSDCLPAATSSLEYAILPHWGDLSLDGIGTGIFTSISGTAPNRIFNIEWRAIVFIQELPANFEVRVYEGRIRFDIVYGVVSGNGIGATVGTQRDSALFTEYDCQSGVLDEGLLL